MLIRTGEERPLSTSSPSSALIVRKLRLFLSGRSMARPGRSGDRIRSSDAYQKIPILQDRRLLQAIQPSGDSICRYRVSIMRMVPEGHCQFHKLRCILKISNVENVTCEKMHGKHLLFERKSLAGTSRSNG